MLGSGGTEQHATQGMRVGPSESVGRGRLQTTSQRITLNGVYGKPAKKKATTSRQVRVEEMNESKPSLKCRK